MRFHSIFLFVIILGSPVRAQEQLVMSVYDKLKEARGDLETSHPTLEITGRIKNVAAYRKEDNRLFLEKKALDVCLSSKDPKSAIAFLLGHELAHFYRDHNWQDGTYFLVDARHLDKHVNEEAEADVYGAFLAYLAGFETIDIVPWLMDSLYRAYELNEDLPGYPALDARKLVASENCQQAERLLDMFEAGNRLNAAGFYHRSSVIYDYLLNYVKAKSLFNNLGVSLLRQVIQLDGSIPFEFPIEIDTEQPFRKAAHINLQAALDRCVTNLEMAVRHDPAYHLGYINLCIGYLLQGKTDRATELIEVLDRIGTTENTDAKLLVLKGILAAEKGDEESAVQFFRYGEKQYPSQRAIFRANMKVIKRKTKKDKIPMDEYHVPVDRMDNIDLYDHKIKEVTIIDSSDPFYPVRFGIEKGDMYSISMIKQGDEEVLINWTTEPDNMTTTGVSTGMPHDMIYEKYGELNVYERLESNGLYIWIPLRSLLFQIDQQGHISGWGLIVSR